MVQGTTSDAGKTVLVAGLCRILARRGVSVAPFKSQNMALNSAVTADGGEIGRAQALQAIAAGLQAHTDMNPVLLKPSTDTAAQVIIHGKAIGNQDATAFHDYKQFAMQAVLESHQRLSDQYSTIIAEGAGSPAEINLREGDIANMGFAEAVDCDVILIADIDRGGVFAHLVGTLALLSASEQARVKGFVINRFRGDISLLEPGLDWLEQHTGKPVIGVLPYLHGLQLDAEDAIDAWQPPATASAIRVVVPVLPRISNHTDFDSLRLNPAVELIYVGIDEPVPNADVIILPGSKSVRNDLQHLLDRGWLKAIKKHLRYGGKLLGICGGFQMLGDIIHDPKGIEGAPGSSKAMSLLNMQTTLKPAKQLERVSGCLLYGSQAAVEGYEVHCGISEGAALSKPFLAFDDARVDGAISADEQIIGTYVHGLFDKAEACSALLDWMGIEDAQTVDIDHIRHRELERLADTIEKHLELSLLGPDFALPAGPASHG